MLRIAFALAAVAMVATPSMAANRCRDAKGHFIACPKPKPAAKVDALASNGMIISTVADITFYGRDQAGNDVSVAGSISVDFGNFGDPS